MIDYVVNAPITDSLPHLISNNPIIKFNVLVYYNTTYSIVSLYLSICRGNVVDDDDIVDEFNLAFFSFSWVIVSISINQTVRFVGKKLYNQSMVDYCNQ